MWQRRQTIYLLLTTIILLVMQVLPVFLLGALDANVADTATGVQGLSREMYSALIYDPNVKEYTVGSVSLLAVISVAAAIISFVTIFLYKNRKMQMRNCRNAQILLLLWYCVCAWVVYGEREAGFTVQFALYIPLVSNVLLQLAYKGIKHDDELVRSADRLR